MAIRFADFIALATEAKDMAHGKVTLPNGKESCDRCGKFHARGKLYKCEECGAVLCHQQVVKQETTNLLYHLIDPGAEKKRRGVSHLNWTEIACGPVKELAGGSWLDLDADGMLNVKQPQTVLWRCCVCGETYGDKPGYRRKDNRPICSECVKKLDRAVR